MNSTELVFLKLGGSLITDKDSPATPRLDVLDRLATEIAAARAASPHMPLLLGHGSGSFGHTAARKYGTRDGVHTREEWLGFADVWKEARALNQLVIDAMVRAGVPVVALPPSAAVTARDGQVLRWDTRPLQSALDAGLVPLINGDTIFDEARGGTILSTEDQFYFLAQQLNPRRILLAGLEDGVWADFPACTRLVDVITPANFNVISGHIGGSASVDVTGGMLEKVRLMISLAELLAGFSAQIFSGVVPGRVYAALAGEKTGTRITLEG